MVSALKYALLCCSLLLATSCSKQAGDQNWPATVGDASSSSTSPSPAADNSAILSELTQAVRRYAAEQRKPPASLDELVARQYLPAVPPAPAGKKFEIDKNLRVYLADR